MIFIRVDFRNRCVRDEEGLMLGHGERDIVEHRATIERLAEPFAGECERVRHFLTTASLPRMVLPEAFSTKM